MKYKFHQKQILRTPLKPLKTSFSKEELQQLFSEKEAQEALFLASPNLLNQCKKWLNNEIDDKKEEDKLVSSLLKYALRMHSRCTPYGLFAACGVVNKPIQNIVLTKKERKRSTRLDMNFTCALTQELAKLTFIQPYLKFYPNNSSYYLQDKIRYIEYYYQNNRRIHQISAVNHSMYLRTILQRAQSGATLNELAQSITDEEVSQTEALQFLKEIVNAQLIVSELEPAVTGEDLLNQIVTVLKSIQNQHFNENLKSILELLLDMLQQLASIDQKIGNEVILYEKLADSLAQLNIPIEISKLFQTDLYIQPNGKCNLPCSQEIEEALKKALTILNQFTSKSSRTNLSEFQKKFYERYEDKEVPLLEVMDTETGIGYALNTNNAGDVNPLVNDLVLPYKKAQETELMWNFKQSFLFHKLKNAEQKNEKTVNIDLKELSDFKIDWDNLPDSFSVMYKHLGKRNAKDLLGIKGVGGSSAVNLLGRFAAANAEIEKLITEIADTEQQNNPNVIYAEIAHLPENRTGNILMRPSFRKYEIPYLAKSSLPQEQQIHLNDLYLSVRNNQLYIRSKRLNKQIIPRLGNAHNFSVNALPVYQFLCDLQLQNLTGALYFDWGMLKNEFSFLPRVEVENVIISSAIWQLKKEQFQELLDKKESILTLAQKWKEKWQMPDLILLVDGDNELLINLTDELNLKMFAAEIKKRPNIILKEFLFDEKTAMVSNEQGNAYTNEFIAILQKEAVSHDDYKANKALAQTTQITKTDRSFSLGSEWLYYKIYCGVKTSDTILREVIKPLTEYLLKQRLIDSWFFIRYADPERHIRIRFCFSDLNNIGIVVQLFKNEIAAYEQTGLIWKIQTDTYQREIERYGTNTMILSEQLFYYDSQCIVNMLEMIDGDEGEEIRWLFAVRAVDELLSDFNYSIAQKKELMENLKTGFASEFNMNKDLKMQLDKKFRNHRKSITDILNRDKDETSEIQPLLKLLNQKSENIAPLVTEILTIHQDKQLQVHLNNLLASYIHMLLNKLFKNKQRLHEMVIYDFMWRTYKSEIAKQKYTKQTIV